MVRLHIRFDRYALNVMTAALLTACGGSQPPIASGAMWQSQASTIATRADRSGSWMVPEAKKDDLLYVSSAHGVYVFSYPQGKSVGSLSGFGYPFGLCSDKKGDVFIVDEQAQDIVVYAHAGKSPIRTLSDAGNYPNGCAVDPTSGKLAVAGGIAQREGTIAIYAAGTGLPTVYQSPYYSIFWYCTYDSHGNLFTTAEAGPNAGALVELPKGSNTVSDIFVNEAFGDGGAVQWDGKYLALADPCGTACRQEGPATIYQVQVSGSSATVVNTINLRVGTGKKNLNADGLEFWIQGHSIVYEEAIHTEHHIEDENVGLWQYPAGGMVTKTIAVLSPFGVTVSKASK
jgi:hypothetical protein